MTSFLCEATSLCTKFQSAICLHCNRRLCLLHIIEHNQTVLDSAQNLSNQVEIIFQEINNKYEQSRETYQNVLVLANQWRLKQIETISQIYEKHIQSIESHQETLNIMHQELTDLLDRDARQPLKLIQTNQNVSIEILNNIQEAMKKVQNNSLQLKWDSSSTLPVTMQHPSSTLNSHPSMQRTPTVYKPRSLRSVNLRKYRSLRRLVEMFSDTSAIEQNKNDIAEYMDKHGHNLPSPILFCSYLTAWYRKFEAHEKNLILQEHLSTVIRHIPNHMDNFSILLGIHAFFYNEHIQGNRKQLMTFLLHYFVEHKCINRQQIFYWYTNKDNNGYKAFDGAKQMTQPFIRSLWTNNIGTDEKAALPNLINVKVEESSPI